MCAVAGGVNAVATFDGYHIAGPAIVFRKLYLTSVVLKVDDNDGVSLNDEGVKLLATHEEIPEQVQRLVLLRPVLL